ncbi:hypothetical protein GIY62_33345 [Burkholderia plantarii]|uniref:hypothetical protein n=1 Tax=Burkholderia plantarii TaxID=41899 RepID=UPI00272BD25C|nr:hypothetical protein [Burkholderia plantarii]WLE62274.1 hypothetical protein GIY62_33345 [Burkholderia plantarii]
MDATRAWVRGEPDRQVRSGGRALSRQFAIAIARRAERFWVRFSGSVFRPVFSLIRTGAKHPAHRNNLTKSTTARKVYG